jgi:DNA-binding MarR family transcriptional regulator
MPIEREQATRLLESLVSLLRVSRTVSHRAAQRSVSATPIALLRLVRETDPRLGDLAEQLMVKPSVASRAVAALESEGYVARVADPTDARACRIHLTDAGRSHLKDREEEAFQLLSTRFADWSPEEAEQSIRLMQRIEGTVLDWVSHLEHAIDDGPTATRSHAEDAATSLEGTPRRTTENTTHSTTWEKTAV